MTRGLQLTFLVHAVVSFVIGLVIYVKPSLLGLLVGDGGDMTRTYGAALLALALASWLASRSARWEDVQIVVILDIALATLSTVGAVWGLLFRSTEPIFWIAVVVWVLFGVAFTYFYIKRPAPA